MELDYDLELEKVAAEINRLKADAKVCLQLPDGLKLYADEIVDELNQKLAAKDKKAHIFVWAGSNFGACDIPIQLKDSDFDLVVNFGHVVFRKKSESN